MDGLKMEILTRGIFGQKYKDDGDGVAADATVAKALILIHQHLV